MRVSNTTQCIILPPNFYFLILIVLIMVGCKSNQPAELPDLTGVLVFDGIEAEDPSLLHLLFSLNVDSALVEAGSAVINAWHVVLNGQKADTGFSLDYTGSFPLRLVMDVAVLAEAGLAPAEDYRVELVLDVDITLGPRTAAVEVIGIAEFPGVRPPEFSITEIAIIRAELINTRFRVGIQIDNPNPFPVELSALRYTLFGNGRLWAEGNERNILHVNENASYQGDIFLIMNFIDMNRALLDQIINLVDVQYRFTGEAQVSTGIEYLPRFTTGFNLAGFSRVLDR